MSGTIRILHMLPDLEIGGGQQVLLRNIEAMNALRDVAESPAAGFEHIVCAVMTGGEMEARLRGSGIETIVLHAHGLIGLVRGVRRLRRLCNERRIDLIHTNNTGSDRLYGQLTAMICGLPVVNTLHAEPPEVLADPDRIKREPLVSRLKLSIRNRLTRRTTRRYVAVSERMRAAWGPYVRLLGSGDERIAVITAGLDPARFRSDPALVRELRAQIAGPDAWPVLMDVTRLVIGKGLEHLPAVMKAVVARRPKARLVLVGEGELRPAIEASAREHGVSTSVVFLGRRHDVPELLQACDLFVFPSHSEGFGLVALEAMAAARPVVAFALPALREFVEPTCGVLVSPVDTAAFERAVLELLGDRERMAAMGERGRQIVEERFSVRRSVEKLAEVYRAVLAGKEVSRRGAEAQRD